MTTETDAKKIELADAINDLVVKQGDLRTLQQAAQQLDGVKAVQAKSVEVQTVQKQINDLRKEIYG